MTGMRVRAAGTLAIVASLGVAAVAGAETVGSDSAPVARAWPADADRCAKDVSWKRRPKAACIAGDRSLVWTPALAFLPEKAVLTPASRKALERVVDLLRRYPEIARLEIQAHFLGRTDESYGLRLGEARAVAVRSVLLEGGVAAHRLVVVNYGSTRPVADTRTAAGRALNRRIELVVRPPADE